MLDSFDMTKLTITTHPLHYYIGVALQGFHQSIQDLLFVMGDGNISSIQMSNFAPLFFPDNGQEKHYFLKIHVYDISIT